MGNAVSFFYLSGSIGKGPKLLSICVIEEIVAFKIAWHLIFPGHASQFQRGVMGLTKVAAFFNQTKQQNYQLFGSQFSSKCIKQG